MISKIDKLFKEIGYRKKMKNEAKIKLTMDVYENKNKERIELWSPTNITIRKKYCYLKECCHLTVQEIKAIYKKCEEKGWLE